MEFEKISQKQAEKIKKFLAIILNPEAIAKDFTEAMEDLKGGSPEALKHRLIMAEIKVDYLTRFTAHFAALVNEKIVDSENEVRRISIAVRKIVKAVESTEKNSSDLNRKLRQLPHLLGKPAGHA